MISGTISDITAPRRRVIAFALLLAVACGRGGRPVLHGDTAKVNARASTPVDSAQLTRVLVASGFDAAQSAVYGSVEKSFVSLPTPADLHVNVRTMQVAIPRSSENDVVFYTVPHGSSGSKRSR